MNIAVTFRHLEADDGVKDYVEKRFKRIKKYMGNFREVHVILSREKFRFIAETILSLNGIQIKGQSQDPDLYKAIDQMVEKIERQIRERKPKARRKRSTSANMEGRVKGAEFFSTNHEDTEILSMVKKRRKLIKPMSIEEAIFQLNVSKKNFYFFINSESGQINVLYRSKDGGYEWIEPQAG